MRSNSLRQLLSLTLLVAAMHVGSPALASTKAAQESRDTPASCTPHDDKSAVSPAQASRTAPEVMVGTDQCHACSLAGTMPVATLIQLHERTRLPGTVLVAQTCQPQDAADSPDAAGPNPGS